MKRCFVFLLTLVLCSTSFSQKEKKMAFNFESLTKEAKWKELPIHERIQAIQIPKEIINDIPTDELLDICLDFPYLLDILFSDDLQTGFKQLCKEFNGYEVLQSRSDFIPSLLNRNRSFVNEAPIIDRNKQNLLSFKWLVLEMLIAQDESLNQLSKDDKALLLSTCKANLNEKKKYTTIYGSLNDIPIYLLFAKDIIMSGTIEIYEKDIQDSIRWFINID